MNINEQPEDKSQEEPAIEINYTLDNESQETAKKLKKKTFEKLISKDLKLIKSHKIKNSTENQK